MKSLTYTFNDIGSATDKAALSLATALTTNTSMEYMKLSWTSAHPDTTLKTMAERVKKSNLRELQLKILIPQRSAGKPQVSMEEVRQWLKYLEVGGKELILSLEDSRLESFSLKHYNFDYSVRGLKSQIRMSLEEAAKSVNTKRKMNYRPVIKFSIRVQ